MLRIKETTPAMINNKIIPKTSVLAQLLTVIQLTDQLKINAEDITKKAISNPKIAPANQLPLVKKFNGSFPGMNAVIVSRKKTMTTATTNPLELNWINSTREASTIKKLDKINEINSIIASLSPRIEVFLRSA